MKYLQHELSAAFPGMNRDDHAKLTADILAYGQREPITLFQGKVLDGWHRYQSCVSIGEKPIFRNMEADADPIALVMSCNLHRRHMDESQRAAAVVACRKWATSGNPNQKTQYGRVSTLGEMAKEADVSTRTIQRAKAAHEAGLGEKVRDGEMTVNAAARLVRHDDCGAGNTDTAYNASRNVPKSADAIIDALEDENKRLESEIKAMQKIVHTNDQVAANAVLAAENIMLKNRIDALIVEKNEVTKLLKRSQSMVKSLQRQLEKPSAPVTIEISSDLPE